MVTHNRIVQDFPYCTTNFFADPPPPFNAAPPSAPTTNTCDPCSTLALMNCLQNNAKPQQKSKNCCSSICSCLAQFLIFVLTLATFMLILMQILLDPYPKSVIKQIWKTRNDQTDWMPSHFHTWSSEKETVNQNHSILIEGKNSP